LQKLLVTWLQPEVPLDSPTAPNWILTKFIRQKTSDPNTGRRIPYVQTIELDNVVHGCAAKMRPKYSFPNPDQADFFGSAIQLITNGTSVDEVIMPQPEDQDQDAVDFDEDDEIDDDDEIEQDVLDV
jgi:hypothetical protein